MITREDIQSFLDRLDGGSLVVKEVEPNLWLARTSDDAEVVVHYAPPVVILRVRVMELPASEPRRGELFRQLLEYNARELVHGSYGLEGDHPGVGFASRRARFLPRKVKCHGNL
jgi:hypothetical protein